MNSGVVYLLSTGETGVLGCREVLKEKNRTSNVLNGVCLLSNEILTGHFCTKVSLNGLTLFEEYPETTIINGKKFFSIDSGDYYVTKDQDNSSILYFSNDLSVNDGDFIVYDEKPVDSGAFSLQESTGVGVWEGTTIPELTGVITNNPPVDIDDLFDRWGVFFNKKRVTRNESSDIDQLTGSAFIYQKDENLTEIQIDYFDVIGTGVIKDQSDLYISGLEKDQNSFLELYTGVNLIETGVSAKVYIEEEIVNSFVF